MDLEKRLTELEKRIERLEKEAAGGTTANQIESIVPKPIDRKRLEKLISLNG